MSETGVIYLHLHKFLIVEGCVMCLIELFKAKSQQQRTFTDYCTPTNALIVYHILV